MHLYEVALKALGVLRSSNNLSAGSSRLWQKLVKKHKGVLVIPAAFSPTRKAMALKILGWVSGSHDVLFPVIRNQEGEKMSLEEFMGEPGSKSYDAAFEAYYEVRA